MLNSRPDDLFVNVMPVIEPLNPSNFASLDITPENSKFKPAATVRTVDEDIDNTKQARKG